MMALRLIVAALSTTIAWGARPAMLLADDADLTEAFDDVRMPQESAGPSRAAAMHNSTLVELRGHGQLIMKHEGHHRPCNCGNCRTKLCLQAVSGCIHLVGSSGLKYATKDLSDDDKLTQVYQAPLQLAGAVSAVYFNNLISSSYPCLVNQEEIDRLKQNQLRQIQDMSGNLQLFKSQIQREQISRQVDVAKLQKQVDSLTAQLKEAQQQVEYLKQMEAAGCSAQVKEGVKQCVDEGCCNKE